MEKGNSTLPGLYLRKAKIEAELRNIRIKRICMTVAAKKKSHSKSRLEKQIEILKHELNKINRCYSTIDDMIDELECELVLEED